MREVSNSILRGYWRGWSMPPPVIPPELKVVARVFVDLQEARQQADYDNSRVWVSIDARNKVTDAQLAFESWAAVRTHPAASEYLLSLLIGSKRE